jgi:glucose/arabinose dehydrogenase
MHQSRALVFLYGILIPTALAAGGPACHETMTPVDNAGPEGGHLELANGSVVLDIPAGALDESVLISTVLATNAPPSPTLVTGTTYEMRPPGLTFNAPVTLTIAYDADAVPTGVLDSELRLYRGVNDAWSEIPGSGRDDGETQVSGSIEGFSTFGVLGVPVASIVLSATNIELAPDETVQLTATTRAANGAELPERVLTWESSNTGVASVTSDGLVTAEGPGSADVSAKAEGVEAVASVVVVSSDAQPGITIVASGLSQPVYVTAPPGDMQRVFIVEQPGTIRILRAGSVLQTPFLDIQSAVLDGGERGLLSIAFHPHYASNGYFFVYYTNNQGNTRVVRYHVSANPDVADASSGDTILTVVQPFSNHNGGLVAFGPNGYLHVGLGDGGSGGDPQGNGQDSTTLLGTLLRLDVNGALPYEIPASNPLVSRPGARPEIWAYGLRNPWRYSFDRVTGDLYIADVGQNQWEEVDVQPASSPGGENYGWNVMEGTHCYGTQNCTMTGLTLPVHEYGHSQGCSVTGGYVYRGSVFPSLQGTYFYADYCEGVIRSFRYENGSVVDHRNWSAQFGNLGAITSFGEDAAGEIYVTTSNGVVHKIVPQ